jgi:signal transduction protein with GAF and PtsI domain
LIQELADTLSVAASAGVIAAPVTHSQLLEMIVRTASHVIAARAASLCLLDEARQELVFEVVLGEKAEELRKIRVPIGHGIAGLVAMTGQPMAISDVQEDPRHASDIARRIGCMPRSIIAVPLFYADRIIGVLELELSSPSSTRGLVRRSRALMPAVHASIFTGLVPPSVVR